MSVAKPAAVTLMAVFFMAVANVGVAGADSYMVRDSRGVVYFTDTPPQGDSTRKIIKVYKTRMVRKHTRTGRAPVYRASPLYNRYDGAIASAAHRYGLDPLLVKSVIKVESDFNRFSISRKGARGLMQLLPQTARLMRVAHIFDPADNINGGARYLRKMLDKFNGNTRLALAAYNAGPNAVKRYGGVPPYPETRRYITKIFRAYNAFSAGGNGMVGAHPVKAAVYTYSTPEGYTVMTDMPVGKGRIITD